MKKRKIKYSMSKCNITSVIKLKRNLLELLNGAEVLEDGSLGIPLVVWIGPMNGGRGGGDNLGILQFFTRFKSSRFTLNSLLMWFGWENGTLVGGKNLGCSTLLTVNLGCSILHGGKSLGCLIKKKIIIKCKYNWLYIQSHIYKSTTFNNNNNHHQS